MTDGYKLMDGRQYYYGKLVDNRYEGIDNVEYIELKLLAGTYQGFQPFSRQPQLDGMEIQCIETYTENDFPFSFQTQGVALPTTANLQNTAIRLYESQKYDKTGGSMKDGVNLYPLISLHRTINGTDPYVRDLPIFACNRMQWEKSGIVFAQSVTFASDVVFVFAVYYSSKLPTLN